MSRNGQQNGETCRSLSEDTLRKDLEESHSCRETCRGNGFWRVLDLNPPSPCLPPPPPKKKTVDFGTVDLPQCQEPPSSPKKTVDFEAGDAFKKTLTFLCFCACRLSSLHSGRSTVPKSTFFVGEEGLLDIREGQRCQNRPFLLGGRAS